MEATKQQWALSLRELVRPPERPPACKVCAAPTRLFDSVDFNQHCGAPPSMFGESGIAVEYYRCDRCGFLFTNLIDDWSAAELSEFIYNADYIKIDPEYLGARAQRTAEHLAPLLISCRDLRILDYGSGSGAFAQSMGAHGFKKVASYDPLSSPQPPRGTFDLITCFEALEHAPQPLDTFAEIAGKLSRKGVVLIGQSLQPDDIEEIRGQWWYLAPRNGHVSFFTHDTFLELAARTRSEIPGWIWGICVYARAAHASNAKGSRADPSRNFARPRLPIGAGTKQGSSTCDASSVAANDSVDTQAAERLVSLIHLAQNLNFGSWRSMTQSEKRFLSRKTRTTRQKGEQRIEGSEGCFAERFVKGGCSHHHNCEPRLLWWIRAAEQIIESSRRLTVCSYP